MTTDRDYVPGNDPSHDSATCSYCESNAYDEDACPECGGDGGTVAEPCDYCEGHGYVGYSW